MPERIDQEKVARMTELAGKACLIGIDETSEAFDLTFISGRMVSFPLMLNRRIDELRRPTETTFDDQLLRRVVGRAFYEGFIVTEYLGDDQGNPDRLLGGVAFKHLDGRVLTFERRKSYELSSSYRYSISGYYSSEEEYTRAIITRGDQEDILDFLVRNFSEEPKLVTGTSS